MKKLFKETRENAEMVVVKASRKIKECLNNERGDILPYVLFIAIIILAVIAISPTVRSIFSDAATTVKNWIADKISEVLQ